MGLELKFEKQNLKSLEENIGAPSKFSDTVVGRDVLRW